MSILITGGAGFIGSHLVDHYIGRGERVCVLDNLSKGGLDNIGRWLDSDGLTFVKGDLLDSSSIDEAIEGCEVVYHLAANPEVRSSRASPSDHFRQNVECTYNLLEAVRKKGDVKSLVFASTSTVYGEPNEIPTPEDYGPLRPISVYGASKLAAEALICSYASMYGFKAVIYRMANVVGPRSDHGVIFDFVQKLKGNPAELEVLGDGTQSKSYLHVEDCVAGMVLGIDMVKENPETLNIGSVDQLNVLSIARIVIGEMGLEDTEIRLTGGVDGGRGWRGDVKIMQLDRSRLMSLGWSPLMNSEEAVRSTARSMIRE